MSYVTLSLLFLTWAGVKSIKSSIFIKYKGPSTPKNEMNKPERCIKKKHTVHYKFTVMLQGIPLNFPFSVSTEVLIKCVGSSEIA